MLVIDDHPAVPRLIELFTKRHGVSAFSTTAIRTVSDAKTWLGSNTPNLVFLDYHLSDSSDVRSSLEHLSTVYDGPIYLLSGAEPHELSEHEMDQRLNGVLHKDDISSGKIADLIADHIPQ